MCYVARPSHSLFGFLEQYLVMKTSYKVLHYAIFSTLLHFLSLKHKYLLVHSFPLSQAQLFTCALFSRKLLVYDLPFMWDNECHSHTKRGKTVVLNTLIFIRLDNKRKHRIFWIELKQEFLEFDVLWCLCIHCWFVSYVGLYEICHIFDGSSSHV
jgi:hypothetical protein